jgi:hypothetical protein
MTPPGSTTTQIKPVVVSAGANAVSFAVPDNPASVNVQLQLPSHVSGNMGGATVTVSNAGASATAVTDSSGLAQVSGLPPGMTYTISATTIDGGTGSTTATLGAGSNGTKTITLAYTGTLVVHCQDTATPPGARVGQLVTVGAASTTTDSSGNAVFTGLAPGTYTANASGHTASATVIGNDSVSVTIAF